MTASTYVSLYERRLKLVQDTLTEHSELSAESSRAGPHPRAHPLIEQRT